ncbi:PREDICTED: coiled-coil domain-containing protein 112-like [Acropora digitifera]|uniref:coiled-coil domain-containing protein 112-like n=1 Tax=Acropora digitifera TaxID=70779 RepID=UPI00077A2365|nr:PREDICTED: coiled-coil domain-containing protein 112-like [Acropora digitifera]
MACMVRGEHQKSIAVGLDSVRVKMRAITESTQAEMAREKRAKDAIAEVYLREEKTLAKRRTILDLIAKVESDIEKVEIKEGMYKERLYFANQRLAENAYRKDFLEKNKVDVAPMELALKEYSEKTKAKLDELAKMQKIIETKEKEILASEKREMIAKDHIMRIEEKHRTIQRAGKRFTKNYTPLTEEEFLEKLEDVKEKIAKEVARRKKAEKTADALEKEILELEKQITLKKKRNLELRQTTNELKGSRV